jgi:rubrerythrin|tara:strand:- start:1658 stop:1873 length:216 start_codon:yes stop_codon:yes gene_type:complete
MIDRNLYEGLLDDEVNEDYADDWYCQNCEHGPLSEDDDRCPRCGTKWNEHFPEEAECDEDGYPIEKYEEVY